MLASVQCLVFIGGRQRNQNTGILSMEDMAFKRRYPINYNINRYHQIDYSGSVLFIGQWLSYKEFSLTIRVCSIYGQQRWITERRIIVNWTLIDRSSRNIVGLWWIILWRCFKIGLLDYLCIMKYWIISHRTRSLSLSLYVYLQSVNHWYCKTMSCIIKRQYFVLVNRMFIMYSLCHFRMINCLLIPPTTRQGMGNGNAHLSLGN